MTIEKSKFYDEQYADLDSDQSKRLDHSLYRVLLPFAKTNKDSACELIGTSQFENVLDLGCGYCEIGARKISQFKRYTAVDISNYQYSKITEKLKNDSRFTFKQHDLNQPLPFANATFDLVISLSAIQYLFDPIAFIKEINLVLKPGGTLILNTLNLAFLLRRLQLLFGHIPTFDNAKGWQGGVLHNFTVPTMRKLLEAEGFAIEKFTCAGVVPPLRLWWPSLLASDMSFFCTKRD